MRRNSPSLNRRIFLTLALAALATRAHAAGHDAEIDKLLRDILDAEPDPQLTLIDQLADLGDLAAVPGLIQMLFWLPIDDDKVLPNALHKLTGARPGETFRDWMVWLQDHPDYKPHAGFEKLLTDLFGGLDPKFRRFLTPDVPRAIRFEEIVWGGVNVDAIPALDDPKMIPAAEATYLNPTDRIFGVALNGDIRAYPERILNWHEMANDTVGGIPVSLAYCTLCNAAILYDGRVPGAPTALTFGTSGLIYRSNKLMYDRTTNSLWQQLTGTPALGALVGSGAQLTQLPLTIASWADWQARHPTTKVLSPDTGFKRDYTSEGAYAAYFASPYLAFPAAVKNTALKPKDLVFGLHTPGANRAWPLSRFATTPLINDRAGLIDVLLLGDATTRTVRAYNSTGHTFTTNGPTLKSTDGTTWTPTEDALLGPNNQSLPRLPGNLAYWFAWSGAYGDDLAQ